MISTFLIFAIIGYFILAIVNLVDKFFLGTTVANPYVYSFLVASFGLVVLAFLPFGLVDLPAVKDILIMLLSGAIFIPSLIIFFKALTIGEVSRVIPLLGSAVPIFSLILSVIFLGEQFSLSEFYGFGLMVIGGTLITITKSARRVKSSHWIWLSLMAALLFSTYFVMADYIFSQVDFITGFFWPRIGSFLVVIFFLLYKPFRYVLYKIWKANSTKKKTGFLANQGLGGLGLFFINLAIFTGAVALVNALQAVQFVFVLIFVIILTFIKPHIIEEHISSKVIAEKILAIILIGIGLFFIT